MPHSGARPSRSWPPRPLSELGAVTRDPVQASVEPSPAANLFPSAGSERGAAAGSVAGCPAPRSREHRVRLGRGGDQASRDRGA